LRAEKPTEPLEKAAVSYLRPIIGLLIHLIFVIDMFFLVWQLIQNQLPHKKSLTFNHRLFIFSLLLSHRSSAGRATDLFPLSPNQYTETL
jgi:hypothetical protein